MNWMWAEREIKSSRITSKDKRKREIAKNWHRDYTQTHTLTHRSIPIDLYLDFKTVYHIRKD